MPTTQLHLTGLPPSVKKHEQAYAGQSLGVEDARQLVSSTRRMPSQGDSSIYHITAAHRVTEPVWNTLLKVLEEPPGHVTFHLYAPSTDAIPRTICSRAHVSREHLPDPVADDATRVLRLCEQGDAISLLREGDRHTDVQSALSTLNALQAHGVRHGQVDLALLADHYKASLAKHVSPRVLMKACLITLATRIRTNTA